MAGFSNYVEDKVMDCLFNATTFTGITDVYVKLHTGDPGDAGTSNAAGETTRKIATFGASSGGAVSNDAALTWTNVSTSEDYTHFSLWDNVSAGNCLGTGTITANAVTAGDTFTIAIGDLDYSVD
jgi:hypothetical protein